MKSILLVKMFLGLVEMTFGLVHASFSLPKWQALKMTFFAPCVTVALYKDNGSNIEHKEIKLKTYFS